MWKLQQLLCSNEATSSCVGVAAIFLSFAQKKKHVVGAPSTSPSSSPSLL